MDFKTLKKTYAIQLNEQQEKAVLSTNGAVLLLAVPGSGKTTVIITRIAYLVECLGVNPKQILTLTYSVAAARDMEERFIKRFGEKQSHELDFRTIHSFCVKVLKEYEIQENKKIFSLIPNQEKIMAVIYHKISGEYANEQIVKEMINKIAYSKNKMLSKQEREEIQVEGISLELFYQAYETYKRQRKQMDFDDQLLYAYQILRKYPNLLAKIQKRYQYIHVDEAQDTSKLQHEIIRLLVTKNLFMVGDEDQSIYGFRAAYPEALLMFKTRYPNAQILLMETNYRSNQEILKVANEFIKQNRNRMDKNIIAGIKRKEEPIKRTECKTLEEQYEYLVKKAVKTKGTLAILYRNNDSALSLIERLQEKKIKFSMRGQDSSFFTSPIVQDIKDFIIFAKDLSNLEVFKKLYYKMNCGIRKEMIEKLEVRNRKETLLAQLLEKEIMPIWQVGKIVNVKRNLHLLRYKNSYDSIKSILQDIGYEEYLKNKENQEQKGSSNRQKINILFSIASRYKKIEQFFKVLEELEDKVKEGSSGSANLVLSTIHASKGLEYDHVIIIDVIDGILPSVSDTQDEKKKEQKKQYEEEVRLFYVGMTRAKKTLEMVSYQKDYQQEVKSSEFVSQIFTKR